MPTQPPNTLSATALTTLDQAKLWLAEGDLDPTQNDRLTWLINAASNTIMEYAQREFVSTLGSGTRAFALKRDGLVTFGKWDLQSASLVQIDTETGGSPSTITTDQYQLWPVDAPHGVYRGLKFYSFTVGPVLRQLYSLGRQVSVTGTWGFASVPADVEQACLITVAKWFRRDQVSWSSELPQPTSSTGNELPLDAIRLLAAYKRFV